MRSKYAFQMRSTRTAEAFPVTEGGDCCSVRANSGLVVGVRLAETEDVAVGERDAEDDAPDWVWGVAVDVCESDGCAEADTKALAETTTDGEIEKLPETEANTIVDKEALLETDAVADVETLDDMSHEEGSVSDAESEVVADGDGE